MKNKKSFLAAGALLCSTLAGTVSPISSVFAEGASSYFDENAISCIIDSYNATNGTSVTAFEEVDYDKVTTLNCSNRDITNFRGIVLFKNLEEASFINNTSLNVNSMDFSQNTKLKALSLYNVGNFYRLDLSHNPDLERMTIGSNNPNIIFPHGVEKLDDGKYGINLNDYKWYTHCKEQGGPCDINIDERLYPYTLDEDANLITFEDKTKIPYYIGFSSPYATFQINSRAGYMRYTIYLNGDEAVESHNPFYVNNNCKKENEYYYCDNSIYSGDTFDTEDIVENTLAKIFNLSAYKLSEVKIVPPKANVELTIDTDTVKKGVALAAADFTIEFHFDLDVKTPETGSFTNSEEKGSVAKLATAIITGVAVSVCSFFYLFKRQKQVKHQ